jgi:dipeptidyl aminopeptidase/acylaminoacyl peptidase
MPWDCMPRWSPDGRTIAFISDRDGGDNVWLVNADGTGARRITKEVDNALSSPMWSPDGQYIVVRRFGAYPTEENYLTNVPLWIYHVGGGTGTQLFHEARHVPPADVHVPAHDRDRVDGRAALPIPAKHHRASYWRAPGRERGPFARRLR